MKFTDSLNNVTTINEDELINKILMELQNQKKYSKSSKLKNKVRLIDKTIEHINNILLQTFVRQGIEFEILPTIAKYKPKIDNLPNFDNYPNKKFIIKYILTAIKLGIIKIDENNNLEVNEDFKVEYNLKNVDEVISDYVMKYVYTTNLVKYALIREDHPKISINFKKDPDVWDIILNSPYYQLCREISSEWLNIDENSYILDAGCGSRSPEYYVSLLKSGQYTGIDISKGLIEIAKNRLKRKAFDGYTLKNLDFCEIIPKEKYDFLICSHCLRYISNIKLFLKKGMNSLVKGGKLLIIEEFFPDLNKDINKELFEFYNSWNTKFIKYYSVDEITKTLNNLGYDYRLETFGNSCLLIEKF